MAQQVILPEMVRRRERRLNGLPAPVQPSHRSWWRRILTSRWTWGYAAMTLLYIGCLLYQWFANFAERKVDGHTVGVSLDILWLCTQAALPTVAVWALVFIILDRWRPSRLGLWWVALGWGAAVATTLSIILNSWAGAHLHVTGDEQDVIGSIRTAVYIAPFVEEATKASVLFLALALLRDRITTRLAIVSMAGLSAIGFAFTENIIYYARAYLFALSNIGTGDPEQALATMVWNRGVLTSFGHWSFTTLTGLGLAWGVRSRSKSVRVLAPLAGYLMASLGHMVFNSQASNLGGENPQRFFAIMLLSACIWLLMLGMTTWFKEGRLLRARLTDYVRTGWLRPDDPMVWGSAWRRWQMLWLAAFEGWRCLLSTVSLIRRATELAYLRDSMTRGLVDAAGLEREKELLGKLRKLRAVAIDDPRGRKHRKVWGRWRRHREVVGSVVSPRVGAN